MERTTAFLILLKRISGLIVKSKFPVLLSPTWHRFLFLWRDYNSFGGNGILDFSKGMLSRPGTFILNHTKGLDLSKIQMPHCPSYISGCEPAGSPNSFVNWQPAGQDRCFHLQGDTPPLHRPDLHSLLLLNSFRGWSTPFTASDFVHNLLMTAKRKMTKILRDVGGVGVWGDKDRCSVLLSFLSGKCQQPKDRSFLFQQTTN